MLKINFLNNRASVAVNSDDGNESAPQEWIGDSNLINILRMRLVEAHTPFGHIFDTEFANPIDLHYAVFTNLADFNPQVVEGAELVETYDPGIPDGAVT